MGNERWAKVLRFVVSVIVILAVMISYLVVRRPNTLNHAIDTISMLPYIMPGAVIGIALILSVSSGVNAYIESVQRDTLASYPIELHAESVDLTALVNTLMNSKGGDAHDHDRNKIYESIVLGQLAHAHLIDLVGIAAASAGVVVGFFTAAGEAYRRHHQSRQQGGAKRTFLFHDKFLLNLDVGDSSGPDGK